MDWVEVFRGPEIEASIRLGFLESQEIECLALRVAPPNLLLRPSGVLGPAADNLSIWQALMVRPEDAERSRDLLGEAASPA